MELAATWKFCSLQRESCYSARCCVAVCNTMILSTLYMLVGSRCALLCLLHPAVRLLRLTKTHIVSKPLPCCWTMSDVPDAREGWSSCFGAAMVAPLPALNCCRVALLRRSDISIQLHQLACESLYSCMPRFCLQPMQDKVKENLTCRSLGRRCCAATPFFAALT